MSTSDRGAKKAAEDLIHQLRLAREFKARLPEIVGERMAAIHEAMRAQGSTSKPEPTEQSDEAPRPAKSDLGLTNEERALALLVHNPELSNAEIARRIGVHRRTVYKWDRYRQARAALKQSRFERPKGTKHEGEVEAWDDE